MPCFFSRGVTTAVFQFLGNNPDCKDRLIIFVIAGRILGSMFFSNVVGIGSSSHDLDLVLTHCFYLILTNFIKVSELVYISVGWLVDGVAMKLFSDLNYLLYKKSGHSLASSSSVSLASSGLFGLQPVRWFTSWNNFLVSCPHSSIFLLIVLIFFQEYFLDIAFLVVDMLSRRS